MGIFDRFSNFLNDHDDLEETYHRDEQLSEQTITSAEQDRYQATNKSNNVIPLKKQTTPRKQAKIYVVEPSGYVDVERIADSLLNGEAVLLNFKRMELAEAIRVIDFLAGVAYAIGGDVRKVREEVFICSPADVIVEGTFAEEEHDFDSYDYER